jgi:hypothetical protein
MVNRRPVQMNAQEGNEITEIVACSRQTEVGGLKVDQFADRAYRAGAQSDRRPAPPTLDEATAKPADYLKADCSANEALTPPGRVAAMEQRLDAMLEATRTCSRRCRASMARSATNGRRASTSSARNTVDENGRHYLPV